MSKLNAVRLLIHLKGPERIVSLDYSDSRELDRQLQAFEEQRTSGRWGRRPGELYEFRNESNDFVAFLDECFLRAEIQGLPEPDDVSRPEGALDRRA